MKNMQAHSKEPGEGMAGKPDPRRASFSLFHFNQGKVRPDSPISTPILGFMLSCYLFHFWFHKVHSSGISPLKYIDRGEKCNETPISPQGWSEPQPSLEGARRLGELHSETTGILGTYLCLHTVSSYKDIGHIRLGGLCYSSTT